MTRRSSGRRSILLRRVEGEAAEVEGEEAEAEEGVAEAEVEEGGSKGVKIRKKNKKRHTKRVVILSRERGHGQSIPPPCQIPMAHDEAP